MTDTTTVKNLGLGPTSRLVIPAATLLSLLLFTGGAAWTLRSMQADQDKAVSAMRGMLEKSIEVTNVRLAGVDAALDRLTQKIDNRYTSRDADKDWSLQQTVNSAQQSLNSKLADTLEALRLRIRELEIRRQGAFSK